MENNLLDDLAYLDKEAPKLVYVGFVKRLLAAIADMFVVGGGMFVLSMLLNFIDLVFGANLYIELAEVLVIPLMFLYAALMESSKYQATLGKQALGIKVVGNNGERISFLRALARFGLKFLSYAFLFIGFIIIAFTRKSQGLHDIITDTFVVENNTRYN